MFFCEKFFCPLICPLYCYRNEFEAGGLRWWLACDLKVLVGVGCWWMWVEISLSRGFPENRQSRGFLKTHKVQDSWKLRSPAYLVSWSWWFALLLMLCACVCRRQAKKKTSPGFSEKTAKSGFCKNSLSPAYLVYWSCWWFALLLMLCACVCRRLALQTRKQVELSVVGLHSKNHRLTQIKKQTNITEVSKPDDVQTKEVRGR